MSKIICDVCGTSFPENAPQCPICGCVRSADSVVVSGDTQEHESRDNGSYTYVKGGRFSKANVKKRNHGKRVPVAPVSAPVEEASDKKSDKGLVIATIVLLLAIVAVVAYIMLRFFAPNWIAQPETSENPKPSTSGQGDVQDDTKDDEPVKIPCTGLTLSKVTAEFDEAGAVLLLNVTPEPADTTDEIVFASDNEAVATVNEDGKIEAVGGGQAIITVTCGDVTAQCRVVCTMPVEEDPTDPSVPAVTEELKLNSRLLDVTLNKKGEVWVCYSGNIPVADITWTSDNEQVATIADGKVTAVGTGKTMIHAEYNGTKVSCIVRCSASVGAADAPASGTENTEQQ